MLTVQDLTKMLKCHRATIARMVVARTMPAPLKIGGLYRWREEDVALWLDYLRAQRDWEAAGNEPHAPDSPAPPVYSTGAAQFDPRTYVARIKERERHERSKTLRNGSAPIADEQLPDEIVGASLGQPATQK